MTSSLIKYSSLDPMPAWLLKSCSDLLAPAVARIFNSSLQLGVFPSCYSEAFIAPRLKKQSLPRTIPPVTVLSRTSQCYRSCLRESWAFNWWTISLLTTTCYQGISWRIGDFIQSRQRSWNTNLVEAMDGGHHALLGPLDLSAVFWYCGSWHPHGSPT